MKCVEVVLVSFEVVLVSFEVVLVSFEVVLVRFEVVLVSFVVTIALKVWLPVYKFRSDILLCWSLCDFSFIWSCVM